MKVKFAKKQPARTDAFVAFIFDGGKSGPGVDDLDKSTKGFVARALKTRDFKGKKGDFLVLVAPDGVKADYVILQGLGKPEELKHPKDFESAGSALGAKLNAERVGKAVVLAGKAREFKVKNATAHFGYGALLNAYRFDKYRTKEEADKKPTLKEMSIVTGDGGAPGAFRELSRIADGVFYARDLVSEPPNELYPKSYADRVKKDLAKLGITISVMTPAQMEKQGMGALLGVGQGSVRDPRLVIMKYDGVPKSAAAKDKKPLAFVGKGITFDTGGISIKPSAGMDEMKWDMGGSATVVGLMMALAGRKARVNAVGAIALAENMPDGNAQRPGDIVKSMSGQTIEVLNTDAEGRLVLADALWYVQEKYKPRLVIDLATLTGAIIIALGHEFAGVFSNDDDIPGQLMCAGEGVDERVWHMPMCDAWDKAIDSPVADMKNIGGGRDAGSCTAAAFLQRFIKEGTPWAHIDIAGMAWSKKDKACVPKGATGFGVRLLDRFVAENYEK